MTTAHIKSELLPNSLERSMVLSDTNRIPQFWGTVYETMTMSGLAEKTVRRKLNAIDRIYRFSASLFKKECLDDIIYNNDINNIDILMDSFFNHLRNQAAQTGICNNSVWEEVKSFIIKMTEMQHKNNCVSENEIRSRMAMKIMRYKNLTPNPSKNRIRIVRAIPSIVLEELYSIFSPISAKNPFRITRHRWRNYVLFITLLHQGLRRGEALLLGTDAIRSDRSRTSLQEAFWINVENRYGDDDPRYCDAPSIKNSQSYRQIPASRELASIVEHFVANFRGRSPFPHLFLNQSGRPLGARGVSDIFQRASLALSDTAKAELEGRMKSPTVSSHDLRHTCAVTRLADMRKNGVGEDDALHSLRAFFGWSYTSTMPRL